MWADEKDGMGNRILCTAVRKEGMIQRSGGDMNSEQLKRIHEKHESRQQAGHSIGVLCSGCLKNIEAEVTENMIMLQSGYSTMTLPKTNSNIDILKKILDGMKTEGEGGKE